MPEPLGKSKEFGLVHSYLRFSDPSQALGHSEQRQLENGEAWVRREKLKFSNIPPFIDDGKSGWRGRKQAKLRALLKEIKSGQHIKSGDILLVEAIDRLSRKGIRETQTLMNTIFAAGVHIQILFPVEKLYRADKDEIGTAVEIAAFAYSAQAYSDLLSGRIKNWWAEQRSKATTKGDKIVSGRLPEWLIRNEDGTFAEVPDKVEAVRHIFKQTIAGVGATVLCAELNERWPKGKRFHKTKKKWISQEWNQTYVRQIIRQRTATGEYQPHVLDEDGKRQPLGEPLPGYYLQVVDEEVWQRANAAMDGRATDRNPTSGFINLFPGLVHNVADDSPCYTYTYQQTRSDGRKITIRRLKSKNARCKVPGACTATVDLPLFEKAFIDYVRELDLAFLNTDHKEDAQSAKLAGQIAVKRNRLRGLQKALTGDEDIDLPEVTMAIRTIKAELDQLQKTQRGTRRPADGLAIKRLAQMPDTSENRMRLREALKQSISRINILPVKIGRANRDPIACLAEIEFKGGQCRRLFLYRGRAMSGSFDAGALSEPSIVKLVKPKTVQIVAACAEIDERLAAGKPAGFRATMQLLGLTKILELIDSPCGRVTSSG